MPSARTPEPLPYRTLRDHRFSHSAHVLTLGVWFWCGDRRTRRGALRLAQRAAQDFAVEAEKVGMDRTEAVEGIR